MLSYSATLTPLQKAVAEYWADGPGNERPPGHWTLFATFISQRDGHDTGQDARMFLALTGAVMDASVSCWDAKRHYDAVRPASAVRFLLRGKTVHAWGGPGHDDAVLPANTWTPYQPVTVVTPPCAEYTSGHSTVSAAAATVLRLITGSDVFGAGVTLPAGSSRVEPGEPTIPVRLTWATFTDAADEAGMSGRYGGVHFRDAEPGRTCCGPPGRSPRLPACPAPLQSQAESEILIPDGDGRMAGR